MGVAVGDALGAPFEGQPAVSLGQVRAVTEGDEPLPRTDDTAMTDGFDWLRFLADGPLELSRCK
ncbi:MAG: ADP-ribosylglycohydrolase family protein [Actinomycetota bacterium]|nr:ADP-ribosylglycohydrolase family protein [Actinomycetota bacterium]